MPLPSPRVAAILLSGFGSPALDGSQEHGFGNGFYTLFEPGGVAGLWEQHAPYLLSEARRLGIKPAWEAPDGQMLFYGEYIAQGGTE